MKTIEQMITRGYKKISDHEWVRKVGRSLVTAELTVHMHPDGANEEMVFTSKAKNVNELVTNEFNWYYEL